MPGGATNARQKLNMELGHHVPPSVDGNLNWVLSSFVSSISNVHLVTLVQVSGQEGYLGQTDRSPGLKVYITTSNLHEQKQTTKFTGVVPGCSGIRKDEPKILPSLPPPEHHQLPSFPITCHTKSV